MTPCVIIKNVLDIRIVRARYTWPFQIQVVHIRPVPEMRMNTVNRHNTSIIKQQPYCIKTTQHLVENNVLNSFDHNQPPIKIGNGKTFLAG